MEKESKPPETEADILTRILLEESETYELFYKPSNFDVIELDVREDNSTDSMESNSSLEASSSKAVKKEIFKKDKSVQTLCSQSIMVVKHKFTNTPS